MKKTIRSLILGVSLVLTGCGLAGYLYAARPGLDPQRFFEDLRSCQTRPLSETWYALVMYPPGIGPAVEAARSRERVRACMEAYGWQAIGRVDTQGDQVLLEEPPTSVRDPMEGHQNWAPAPPER